MSYVYDEAADRKLARILESLVNELVQELSPRAILLTGSLGRSEGSAEIRDGDLRFISDCELVVLPLTPRMKRSAEVITSKYGKEYDLDIDISGIVKSVQLMTPLVRWMSPTIDNYDLRYGSTLLHGRDYRESMPAFNPEDIPPWEGFRLIFNRLAKLLTDDVVRGYWFDKLVLSLRDALLLSNDSYTSSYDRRQQLFEQVNISDICVDSGTYEQICRCSSEATDRRRACSLVNRTEQQIDQIVTLTSRVLVSLAEAHFGHRPTDLSSFKENFLQSETTRSFNRFPGGHPFIQNTLSAGRYLSEVNYLPKLQDLTTNWSHDIYTTIPIAFKHRFYSGSTSNLHQEIQRIVSKYHRHPETESSIYDALATCWKRYCW